MLVESTIIDIAASPRGPSLIYLVEQFLNNPEVPAAFNAVVAGFQDPPQSYGFGNPWKAVSSGNELPLLMLSNFTEWCLFRASIANPTVLGTARR